MIQQFYHDVCRIQDLKISYANDVVYDSHNSDDCNTDDSGDNTDGGMTNMDDTNMYDMDASNSSHYNNSNDNYMDNIRDTTMAPRYGTTHPKLGRTKT